MVEEKQAEFTVFKGGPIEVRGNFVLKDKDGNVLETKEIIYLCRCGASDHKPFCDGSHHRAGLKD